MGEKEVRWHDWEYFYFDKLSRQINKYGLYMRYGPIYNPKMFGIRTKWTSKKK